MPKEPTLSSIQKKKDRYSIKQTPSHDTMAKKPETKPTARTKYRPKHPKTAHGYYFQTSRTPIFNKSQGCEDDVQGTLSNQIKISNFLLFVRLCFYYQRKKIKIVKTNFLLY